MPLETVHTPLNHYAHCLGALHTTVKNPDSDGREDVDGNIKTSTMKSTGSEEPKTPCRLPLYHSILDL